MFRADPQHDPNGEFYQLHRAAYVFVENNRNQFLLQHRSEERQYYPGAISLAAGGVMNPDELNDLDAQRVLEDKLGITKENYQIKFVGE